VHIYQRVNATFQEVHVSFFLFSFFLQIPPLFLDVQPHHKVLDSKPHSSFTFIFGG
jgi:hypothetical protein